jgi:hypothetical protein
LNKGILEADHSHGKSGNSVQRQIIIVSTILMIATGAWSVEAPVWPYEQAQSAPSTNPIDDIVLSAQAEAGIQGAHGCSDAVFFRRVYLDVIGTLPEFREVTAFLKDERPNKRAIIIDQILERPEFADYWALKWCDLLRVKAEFPINLWPNAVQAYHRWIRDALHDNMPYDDFARALLTSSGSNFRVPQVNFYRAVQDQEPETLAAAAALTFMGTRLDQWPGKQRVQMEAFFSRVGYKGTAEWKEEIVYLNPTFTDTLVTRYPDGARVRIAPTEDPRKVFAAWLTQEDNPWFARAMVNRTWCWLMGRGIVHEPDDIRPDNPPSIPGLLEVLEAELLTSNYNLKAVFRLILNSQTYQQSSISQSTHPRAEALFATYLPRRLDAEVLIDALDVLLGAREKYTSPIPEPFTFIPDVDRTITLADGSITSQFLELYGRPARDTGLASERNNVITDKQRLHMLNSSHIQQKIERSGRIRQLMKNAKRRPRQFLDSVYLSVLSRRPTKAERATVGAFFQEGGLNARQATCDLVWALINSKEFQFKH